MATQGKTRTGNGLVGSVPELHEDPPIVTVFYPFDGRRPAVVACGLAQGLAARGVKTVLVDMDTQGWATDLSGINSAKVEIESTLFSARHDKESGTWVPPEAVRLKEGHDLVRAAFLRMDTINLPMHVWYRRPEHSFVEGALSALASSGGYEVVITSCPPVGDTLCYPTLRAASHFVSLVELTEMGLRTLREVTIPTIRPDAEGRFSALVALHGANEGREQVMEDLNGLEGDEVLLGALPQLLNRYHSRHPEEFSDDDTREGELRQGLDYLASELLLRLRLRVG